VKELAVSFTFFYNSFIYQTFPTKKTLFKNAIKSGGKIMFIECKK